MRDRIVAAVLEWLAAYLHERLIDKVVGSESTAAFEKARQIIRECAAVGLLFGRCGVRVDLVDDLTKASAKLFLQRRPAEHDHEHGDDMGEQHDAHGDLVGDHERSTQTFDAQIADHAERHDEPAHDHEHNSDGADGRRMQEVVDAVDFDEIGEHGAPFENARRDEHHETDDEEEKVDDEQQEAHCPSEIAQLFGRVHFVGCFSLFVSNFIFSCFY